MYLYYTLKAGEFQVPLEIKRNIYNITKFLTGNQNLRGALVRGLVFAPHTGLKPYNSK